MTNISLNSIDISLDSLIHHKLSIEDDLASKNYSDERILKKVNQLKDIQKTIKELINLTRELRG